ncbi:unnamed protein product [Trichobilharzia regenti]|nr:unnamed protein product [Trichobilharzia regenti]
MASAENTDVKLSSDDIHQESCIQKESVGKEEKLTSKKSPSSVKSVTSSSSASTCSNSSMPKSSSGVNNSTSNKTKSTNTKSSGVKQTAKTNSGTDMSSTAVSGAAGGGNGSGGGKPNASASNPSSSSGCKNSGKNSNKDEYTLKLEAESKQLKSEIQSLRSSEVQLRSQVQQSLSIERTYRSESFQAQQEYESLQVKYNQLSQRYETDHASLQAMEKSLAEERKQRLLLEEQLKRQSKKRTGEKTSETVSNGPVTSKATNSKASMTEVRSSSFVACDGTVAEVCKNNEACAARRHELELEIETLTKSLTDKDNQLSSLNSERLSNELNESSDKSSKKQSKCERTKQSDSVSLDQQYNLSTRHQKHEITETELNDLASRVNALQEENQRLSDTLKEEDKMKQELMTAYHSSLKEITELNATLTKKEYQIVELNKRLNCLTPNFCEYVSRMTASASNCAKPPNCRVTVEDTSNEDCTINSYSVLDTSQLYTNYSKNQNDERNHLDLSVSNLPLSNRLNSFNQSYSMTAYEASASMNNLSSQKSNIFFSDSCTKTKPFSPSHFSFTDRNIHGIADLTNTVNPSNLDYFSHCPLSNGGISSSSLTNTGLGYHTSSDGNCQLNSRMHFRPDKLPNSNILFDSSGFPNHFENLGVECLNGGYSSYDNPILNRVLPTSSMPLCGARALPVGSSAPASSPPPLFVPPPGILQNDITSNIFHYSHSINVTSSLPSLEVSENSSADSMTIASTAVGSSFSPRVVPDAYSTEVIQTAGMNLNHHEGLSSKSHRLNFNGQICDNTTSNTNSHSVFAKPNANSCSQFGMINTNDDKSNCFDFTTFGPVGSSSPAGTIIHANLITSNCGSSVLSNLNPASLKSRQGSSDTHSNEGLRFPVISPPASHADANSNSTVM